MQYTNAPDAELAVFPDGPPADSQAFRIHETFTTRTLSAPYPTLAVWESRRKHLLRQLREKVFAALPGTVRGLRVERFAAGPGLPSRYEELRLSSDDTPAVRGLRRRPAKPSGRAPALLYIACDGETPASIHDFLYGVNERDVAVRLIVFPRGISVAPWDRSLWKDRQRNAMFVDQTVDSMRLADVTIAVEALRRDEGVDPTKIMLMGEGASGALGLYAAILDPGHRSDDARQSTGYSRRQLDLSKRPALHRPARGRRAAGPAPRDVL